MFCGVQALYDTSTPPASSSPAHNTDVNDTAQSTGPETVVELPRHSSDEIPHRLDERHSIQDENNTSRW